MAPEYAMRGHLSDKADVYSYGIVVLEIVSGKSNTTYQAKENSFYLLDWVTQNSKFESNFMFHQLYLIDFGYKFFFISHIQMTNIND